MTTITWISTLERMPPRIFLDHEPFVSYYEIIKLKVISEVAHNPCVITKGPIWIAALSS